SVPCQHLPAVDLSDLLLTEQRVELASYVARAGRDLRSRSLPWVAAAVPGRVSYRAIGSARRGGEPEKVAKVPLFLVCDHLSVRLAAIVVYAGLVELAVAAAVEIGSATFADVSRTDPGQADFGSAEIAGAAHAAPFPAKWLSSQFAQSSSR